MKEASYSTAQVAKLLGISKRQLVRWLIEGKVVEPKRVELAGQELRVWTAKDIKRVQRYVETRDRKYGTLKKLVRATSSKRPKLTAGGNKKLLAIGPVLTDALMPEFVNFSADPSDILTPGELAERLKVKPAWVYEQTRRRGKVRGQPRIPFRKIGKHLRFSWPDVVKWIESLGQSDE